MSVLLGTNDAATFNWEEYDGFEGASFEDCLALMEEDFDTVCMEIIRHYEKYFCGSMLVVLGYRDDFEIEEEGGVITDDIALLLDLCSCDVSYLYQWNQDLLIRTIENGRNIFYVIRVLTFEGETRFKEFDLKYDYDKMGVDSRKLLHKTFFNADKLSEPMFKDELLVEDVGDDIRALL